MFTLKDRKNLKHSFTMKFIQKALQGKYQDSIKFDSNTLKITVMEGEKIKGMCQDIIKALGPHKWRHLKTLSLDFGSFGGANSQIPGALEIILNRNPELENLDLIFKNRNFPDPELKSLGDLISTILPKLKKLSIDLSNTYRGSEESLCILAKQLQRITKLEKLSLIANGWSNVNDAHVSSFGNIIGRMQSLGYLNLGFSQCHALGDDGVQYLLSKISKNLVRLQGFGLNLMGCLKLTDKSLIALGLGIGDKPRKFKQLKLNLAACHQITDEGVMSLGYSIGNYLEKLESLSLSFYCCEKVTDKSFQSLITAICKHSASLKDLDLNFYGCSRISQAGFKTLSTELGSNFRNLQKLALNLSMNLNITDSEVEALAHQISSNMNDLKQLSLSFSACKKISDNALNHLASAIYTKLNKLEKASLFLNDCPEITDEGLKTIANNVKDLPQLKYFRFGFIINSQKVTIAILSFLKKTLGHIPGFNLQCF